MHQIIGTTIAALKIGTPTTFRNLAIFPLLNGGGGQPDYLTLDESLALKLAKIPRGQYKRIGA